MERYFYTAKRFRWVIAGVLLTLLLTGAISAYTEYSNTFESAATVWVQRISQGLLQVRDQSTDQPSVSNFLTPGNEYAEAFGQLVQTQAFLRETVERTSLRDELARARNAQIYLDDVRKRFRVQALGTNLVRVSFRASSPQVAFEVVSAALAIRDERAMQDQIGATTIASAFYAREFELAQQESLRAQQDLDDFHAAHKGILGAADDSKERQLRLASDLAQVRLGNLKTTIDRAAISSALLQLGQTADVKMIDKPQVQLEPSGGLRQAALLFGVMLAGALALAALLVVVGTLVTASVASEADLTRIGSATLLAAIPQVDRVGIKGPKKDLRSSLADAAFGVDSATAGREAAS